MSTNYNGWNLYDKVIIVEKVIFNYERQEDGSSKMVDSGRRQGYIVDPKNKKQLESALYWAQTGRYVYDAEKGYSELVDKHDGVQYEFDNDGFEIELLNSAENSSQGGKLSFWNCNIMKDGHTWEIGIAADLLLRALVSCTWINGRCQEPVMFARCKGGVGVLSKSSPEYIEAQNDMKAKANMSKGRTTKWKEGHIYETVTSSSVCIGKIYRWYDPIMEYKSYGWTSRETLVGFKLRKEPEVHYLVWDTDKKATHASEYLKLPYCTILERCPARKESDRTIVMDVTNSDIDNSLWERSFYKYTLSSDTYYVDFRKFGYSTDPNNPLIFDEEKLKFIKDELKLKIEM